MLFSITVDVSHKIYTVKTYERYLIELLAHAVVVDMIGMLAITGSKLG